MSTAAASLAKADHLDAIKSHSPASNNSWSGPAASKIGEQRCGPRIKQRGTSPGRTWLLSVINISITPYTYNEEFSGSTGVLSKDNLKIASLVYLVWKVRETAVKEFVERYSTLYEDRNPDKIVSVADNNFLKEPLRTYARDEIQQLNGLEIKDRIVPIGASIQRAESGKT